MVSYGFLIEKLKTASWFYPVTNTFSLPLRTAETVSETKTGIWFTIVRFVCRKTKQASLNIKREIPFIPIRNHEEIIRLFVLISVCIRKLS